MAKEEALRLEAKVVEAQELDAARNETVMQVIARYTCRSQGISCFDKQSGLH